MENIEHKAPAQPTPKYHHSIQGKLFLVVLGFSLIITVGGILLLKNYVPTEQIPLNQSMCEWRPSGENYGPCAQVLGVYFNGKSCVPISGCDSGDDVIPFGYGQLEQCSSLCGGTNIQPQTTDTPTWQTYRNEEFGFEFRYPADYFSISILQGKGLVELRSKRSSPDGVGASLLVSINKAETSEAVEWQLSDDAALLDRRLGFAELKQNFGPEITGTFLGDPPRGLYLVFVPVPGKTDEWVKFSFDVSQINEPAYGGNFEDESIARGILSTFRFIGPDDPENTFSTPLFINGYYETCTDNTTVYKQADGWQKVSNELPSKGLYYLDDKFVGYGMCDVVVCQELPKSYTVELVEYEKVGEKAPPAGSGSTAESLPVYQTIPLSSDIKIEVQYYSDKNCQNQKTSSTIILVEK